MVESKEISKKSAFVSIIKAIRWEDALKNQILVWRLATGMLFVGSVLDLTFSLNSASSVIDDVWDYALKMLVGLFMLGLYTSTYKIGHWDDLHNSNVKLAEMQHKNVIEYTKRIITYLTVDLIPNMSDNNKKLELIRSIPNLLGLVSMEDLTKNLGMFQQSLVESLSLFEMEVKNIGKDVIAKVSDTLDKAIPVPDFLKAEDDEELDEEEEQIDEVEEVEEIVEVASAVVAAEEIEEILEEEEVEEDDEEVEYEEVEEEEEIEEDSDNSGVDPMFT